MTNRKPRVYFTLTIIIIIALLLLKQCGTDCVQNTAINNDGKDALINSDKKSSSPPNHEVKNFSPIQEKKTEVFETKAPAFQQSKVFTSVTLIVEGISSEDVYAIIDESALDSTKIDWKSLQESLVKLVPLWKIEELNKFLEYDAERKITWIQLRSLKISGYYVKYDEGKQEITVWVSGSDKVSRDISLTKEHTANPLDIDPTAVSGFVNFFANKSVTSGELYSNNSDKSSPGQVYVDANLNVKGFVLQSTGSYLEGFGYQRQNLNLSKDNETHAIRCSMGDVQTAHGGYLTPLTLGGFSVRREDSISPYKILTPINEYEILLKTNAILTVEINGHRVFEKHVDSGTYDIRNFPFTTGVNNAVIVVLDPVTRTVIDELKLTPFSFSPAILRRGHNEFNYAVGKKRIETTFLGSKQIIPRNSKEVAGRFYEDEGTTAVLSHKYGLLDRVTVGGYAQIERNYNLTGGAVSFALPYGVLTAETAYSDNQLYLTSGTAVKLEYNLSFRKFFARLGLEKRYFQFSLDSEVFSPQSIDRAGYWAVGFPITNKLSSYYSGRQNFDKSDNSTWQHSISLSNMFSPQLHASITGSLTKSNPGSAQVDTDIFVSLTYAFTGGNVYSHADSLTQSAQADINYNKRITRDTDYGVSAGVGVSPSGQNGDLGAAYHGEKENLTITNGTALQNGKIGNTTSASAATAIAFANNVATITKPITGSFVLFKGYDAFKDEKILINPSGDYISSLAETDFLGVASVSTTPYVDSEFMIGLPELKDGLYIEKEYFPVHSTYKSGTLIKIKNILTSSITGTLLDKNGKPVNKISGELRAINGKVNEEPAFFFTNDKGYFFIEGLKNFMYELTFFGQEGTMNIVIPGTEAGKKDLGEVHAPIGD